MHTRSGYLTRFAALVAAILATTGIAVAADQQAPGAATQAPTAVTATGATLRGLVNPGGERASYWFEVGPTTAYGKSTPILRAGRGDDDVAVNAAVDGLQPQTTYHVRLVASANDQVRPGADVTFTTAQAGTQAPPASGAPSPLPGTELVPAPSAPPVLGQSVGVAPASGVVFVRVPGATHSAALSEAASIPLGSVVDTRNGSVALRAALPAARTQTGTFRGGLFEVRQPAGGHGMTELVLRGALPTCPAGGARAAAVGRKRPPRSLWGHDRHGHFRTRASNSVITVRGTTWYVADRCDGTLTRVTSGSVSVRDLHRHRTAVVRAGHSYLARPG